MTNETSKVAIVTGASRGIGAAVAERLAADSFTVVINYSGDTKSAEALVRKIEGNGGRALTAKADVSDPNAVRGMFDAAEAAFGGVDVLVNNAGIMKLAKIADSDDALFDQQIAVNLKGSFNAMREAARRLRDGGRIVNFSTSVVGTKVETYGIYAATKSAIETMTAILSKEMRGRGITVNAVAPGPTATDLFLNGKSLGRKTKGKFQYRLHWDDVKYEPGELRVVAYKKGKRWAEDVMKTTGTVSQVALSADRTRIKADGRDLSFVTVRLTDAAGLLVPRSKNRIKFSVSGPGEIVAVDNGDATSHESFQSPERNAYNGMALVVVRTKKGKPGQIRLHAESNGLRVGDVTVISVR
jgi:3-oxoacyl-[acyl-carrier protein] reductase